MSRWAISQPSRSAARSRRPRPVPIAAAYIAYESATLRETYETIAWAAWVLLTAQAIAILLMRRRLSRPTP
jgi:hypothetical protein